MKPINTAHIGLAAKNLDDAEQSRKAAGNRLSALLRPVDQMGYGLDVDHPLVQHQAGFVAALLCDAGALKEVGWPKPAKERGKPCCMEHGAIKALEKAVKANPLGPWIEQQKGVGLKQVGRLLGEISDPYWHNGYFDTGAVDKDGSPIMKAYDRPRTVSELWSYCGMGVVNGEAPRHMKGRQGNWNDAARMRLWNIAGACLKAQGPYAEIYYATREHYADAVHDRECRRCGPSGKPAQPGSPLSLGHQHARALRKVGKEVLKDLWREAKRIHESE